MLIQSNTWFACNSNRMSSRRTKASKVSCHVN